jgi:hypothetical protein
MASSGFRLQGGRLELHMVGLLPFKLGLSVDPNGTFDPKTGRATVHGFITTTRPTVVHLNGSVRQKLGRRIIQSAFDLSVPCTNTAPWTATVESSTGSFGGGTTEVSLDARANDPITSESANATTVSSTKLNHSNR